MTPAIGERHRPALAYRIGQCCTALNMAWSLWPAQLLEGEKGFIDDRHRMTRRE
jgi:hypothetical protein